MCLKNVFKPIFWGTSKNWWLDLKVCEDPSWLIVLKNGLKKCSSFKNYIVIDVWSWCKNITEKKEEKEEEHQLVFGVMMTDRQTDIHVFLHLWLCVWWWRNQSQLSQLGAWVQPMGRYHYKTRGEKWVIGGNKKWICLTKIWCGTRLLPPPPPPGGKISNFPPFFLMTPPSSCCLLGLMSIKTCNYSRVHWSCLESQTSLKIGVFCT